MCWGQLPGTVTFEESWQGLGGASGDAEVGPKAPAHCRGSRQGRWPHSAKDTRPPGPQAIHTVHIFKRSAEMPGAGESVTSAWAQAGRLCFGNELEAI